MLCGSQLGTSMVICFQRPTIVPTRHELARCESTANPFAGHRRETQPPTHLGLVEGNPCHGVGVVVERCVTRCAGATCLSKLQRDHPSTPRNYGASWEIRGRYISRTSTTITQPAHDLEQMEITATHKRCQHLTPDDVVQRIPRLQRREVCAVAAYKFYCSPALLLFDRVF